MDDITIISLLSSTLSFFIGFILARAHSGLRIGSIESKFLKCKTIIFDMLDDDKEEYSVKAGRIKNILSYVSLEIKRIKNLS